MGCYSSSSFFASMHIAPIKTFFGSPAVYIPTLLKLQYTWGRLKPPNLILQHMWSKNCDF